MARRLREGSGKMVVHTGRTIMTAHRPLDNRAVMGVLCAGAASSRMAPAADSARLMTAGDAKLTWDCPAFMPEDFLLAALHGDPTRENADVRRNIPSENSFRVFRIRPHCSTTFGVGAGISAYTIGMAVGPADTITSAAGRTGVATVSSRLRGYRSRATSGMTLLDEAVGIEKIFHRDAAME